ncbi:MAG: DNA-binding protein [Alphaproteobacteria bacterium]|nr:MAG: DNA-binding protein [Alphaproteobacteria bacterium]
MFTHSDIWVAIDRLANGAGYSTSGLARKAGLDATAFNKSKRMSPEGKPRWPSTESLAKILSVTHITMTDFMTLIEVETISSHPVQPPSTIPVIGYAQAGTSGFFDDAGFPQGEGWDTVELPAVTPTDNSTYALEVSGDSMEPLYRDGDIIVVSPNSGVRRGDRVVIKTNDGQVMAKELSRKTTSRIELKSLNTDHDDLTFAPKELEWIARILWVSQ